jgi:hypothetical protein
MNKMIFFIATLATSTLTLTLSVSAMADSIPAIHLSNLTPNQQLTAYYGNGSPPWTQEGGGLPTIRNVYLGPVITSIGSDGSADLNAQTITHPGVAVTNYVILLVTDPSQPSVYFKNVNGTIPSFPGVSNTQTLAADEFVREGIQYINLFITQASSDGSISLSYNPMIFNVGTAAH